MGVLSACTNTNEEVPENQIDALEAEESLATLSYLANGFIRLSPQTVSNTSVAFLANGNGFVIEEEMDEVNVYMDRLKLFINDGTDSLGSVETTTSEREEYENKLVFSVEEESFELHYNVSELTGEITGILLVGDVEYTISATEDFEEDSETGEAILEDDDETDLEDEDDEADVEDDEEENESKMVLVAVNGDDSIKVTYKLEQEEDESTVKFHLLETISGVEREIKMKMVSEEDHYKITVEDEDGKYTFKQNGDEDGVTMYKLEYDINGTKGQVMIRETVNENGELEYEYRIQEKGQNKTIRRGRPEEEEEDDTEDESNETSSL